MSCNIEFYEISFVKQCNETMIFARCAIEKSKKLLIYRKDKIYAIVLDVHFA